MRISSTQDLVPVGDATVRNGVKPEPVGLAEVKPGNDVVAVSSAAAQMGALDSSVEFDGAKVDAIRQAIRDGQFKINPAAIADRLIADASSLLGPR